MAKGGAEYSHGPNRVNWTCPCLELIRVFSRKIPRSRRTPADAAVAMSRFRRSRADCTRPNKTTSAQLLQIEITLTFAAPAQAESRRVLERSRTVRTTYYPSEEMPRTPRMNSHRQFGDWLTIRQDWHRAATMVRERAIVIDSQVAIDRRPQIVRRQRAVFGMLALRIG